MDKVQKYNSFNTFPHTKVSVKLIYSEELSSFPHSNSVIMSHLRSTVNQKCQILSENAYITYVNFNKGRDGLI
jgi:hypothetical protein